MLVKDECWEQDADIVVVGYGGAGAIAAITAHDSGAEVLVVEKQAQGSHYTNTSMSGGGLMRPNDVQVFIRYLESLNRVEGNLFWTDRKISEALAAYSYENKAWVEGLGGKLKLFASAAGEHKEVPGYECMEIWKFAGSGVGMHRFLTSQVAQRGIRVLFDARANKLLTNSRGEVVGVRVIVDQGKRRIDIKARKAVIMTTGGFEFDETMKLNYLMVYPTHFFGTPANTGDGHRMVMELGADLWHMNCCSAQVVAKFPEFPIAFILEFGGAGWLHRLHKNKTSKEPAGYIIVDRDGKRFTSENPKLHALYYELTLYDSIRGLYPRVPCFGIFDQRRMEAGRLIYANAGPAGPVQLYHWSLDNRVELEKGWIIQARSVAELAQKLELPKANLVQTVRHYNTYCKQGRDPEFSRRLSDLVPLSEPPFYAVRLYPGGPNTQGGPRRNHRAQVMNVDGNPIPRLYAAGEFGSVFGMLYPSGGSNIAECIAFGRIAGENAVREKPR